METHQQQCVQRLSKLPLWIIEYIWTHRMADVLEDVDPSDWPDLGSQPLSLEDSGRLRVVSAKVYSIVKNRDKEHFEKVLTFLDDTYRLLPRLVSTIKHMKIVFGLKTMIIMWMLERGRGMIDIMFKINQFFPCRLPQYQNQCSQHEMFLMKKNHMDFKDLAQALAMDKGKCERYVTNQMQLQYGEHYAQKVEDRLLQYLQKLETALPGDAYIDEIRKKESPVSEEEKMLLEVISSDSTTIAATLKKLLHCEVTLLNLGKELSEHQSAGVQLSSSPLRAASSETFFRALNFRADVQFRGREDAPDPDILVDSPLLLENEKDLESRPAQQTNGAGQTTERVEESSEEFHEANRSPQFCSKHQRWVKSILQECPEECSDNSLRQANVSPPLFLPSSSRTSSQDLTPSDLIPWPAERQHPTPDGSARLQTPEKTSSKDQVASRSPTHDTSKSRPLLQPASSRDSQIPILSPRVQLIDIASVGGTALSFKLPQSFPNHFTGTARHQEALGSSNRALSSPQCQSSGHNALLQKARSNSLNNIRDGGADPGSSSTSSVKEPRAYLPRCPHLSDDPSISAHPTRDASTSPWQAETPSAPSAGNKITPSTKSCQQNVPVDSLQMSLDTRGHNPLPQTSSTPKDATARARGGRFQRALRLSLPCQAALLQSKLLQPCVSLGRLSFQHCHQATDGRSSGGHEERASQSSSDDNGEERRMEEDENGESSFDLNLLYSSYSSSSSGGDSTLLDPDYKPCIKKKRLLLEYEAARNSANYS